jgi:hypothetical protein
VRVVRRHLVLWYVREILSCSQARIPQKCLVLNIHHEHNRL